MKRLLTIFLLLITVASFGQPLCNAILLKSQVASFTPPTANLLGDWDASNTSTITIATGVSQWNDANGSGHNLLQSTGANQPILSGSGSSSTITFNGTSQFMQAAFTLTAFPTTMYLVVDLISYSGIRFIVDGKNDQSMGILTISPNINLQQSGNFGAAQAYSIGSYKVFTANYVAGTSTLSINDGTKTTLSMYANAPGGITIGNEGGGGGLTNIAVKEILLYNVSHSNATQTSIVSYLRTKWGI